MNNLSPQSPVKNIGSDQISYQGDQLIVYAATDMPDWYVKNYRKLAIHFEGRRYFVVERKALEAGRYYYRLEPWPANLNDFAGGEIEYNEDYVAARDAHLVQLEKERYGNLLLLPFQPLLGFIPLKLKKDLENDYGINAASCTIMSVWLEYLLLFVMGCFIVVGMFTSAFDIIPLIIGIIIVLPDAIVRYDQHMKEEDPFGFYEWVLHIKKF